MHNVKHIFLTYQMYLIEPASRRFKKMEDNKTIERIFSFLSDFKQVNSMIESTDIGRPAMEAVIEELEVVFPFNNEFDLAFHYRNRQIIGSMIRYIMGHYGYRTEKSTKLKKGEFIQSAIVFKKF